MLNTLHKPVDLLTTITAKPARSHLPPYFSTDASESNTPAERQIDREDNIKVDGASHLSGDSNTVTVQSDGGDLMAGG
jgi:hypothetical protein